MNLPGREKLQTLADAYPLGGIALTADVISEVVGLPEEEPDRFVVMPRQALRSLVDGLGEVEQEARGRRNAGGTQEESRR